MFKIKRVVEYRENRGFLTLSTYLILQKNIKLVPLWKITISLLILNNNIKCFQRNMTRFDALLVKYWQLFKQQENNLIAVSLKLLKNGKL